MRRMRILAAILGLALLEAPAVLAQSADLSIEANARFLAENAKKPGVNRTASGLQFKILQNGFGRRPGPSDTVTVYYTGTLINGALFDGTSPGLPAYLPVAKVVPGWKEAIQRMREGDHWMIWIPANIGYGARGGGDGMVPPNQTLVFDVRLVATKPPPQRGDPDYVPSQEEREQMGGR